MSISRTGAVLGAVALTAVLVTRLAPAQTHRSPAQARRDRTAASLRTLVAAERAFSENSVRHGMKAAFLAYLSDDGVIFRPIPINGKKSWEERSDPKSSLSWEPAFAEVSAAGDLGYDTGPWVLLLPASSSTSRLYGHFVSVWHRPPGGTWKVEVDLGITHPAPQSGGVGSHEFVAGPAPLKVPSGEVSDLRKLDDQYSDLTHDKGVAEAFAAMAAPDVRLNREGTFPFVGLAAARAGLDSLAGSLHFLTDGKRLSDSRDLGYTYGIAQHFLPNAAASDLAADSSVYLHVWRQNPDKTWKLALEVLNPLPPTGNK